MVLHLPMHSTHAHTHTHTGFHWAIICVTFTCVALRLIVYKFAGQLPSLVFQPVSINMAAILCYESLILI